MGFLGPLIESIESALPLLGREGQPAERLAQEGLSAAARAAIDDAKQIGRTVAAEVKDVKAATNAIAKDASTILTDVKAAVQHAGAELSADVKSVGAELKHSIGHVFGVLEKFNTTVSAVQNGELIGEAVEGEVKKLRQGADERRTPTATDPQAPRAVDTAKSGAPEHPLAHPALAKERPDEAGQHARPNVEIGSVGGAVVQLQRGLGITADGIAGPETAAAVKDFQRTHGLVPDGIAGPKTWAVLIAKAEPTLAPGSQGDAVRRVQAELGVRADGIDGTQTTAAVRDFQREHGLRADGVVGAQTWDALDKAQVDKTGRQVPVGRADSGPADAARQRPETHLTLVYDGEQRHAAAGYRQSGQILSNADGLVTQSTGRGTVTYSLSELHGHTADVGALDRQLAPGNTVTIAAGADGITVTSLDRSRGHDIAREM